MGRVIKLIIYGCGKNRNELAWPIFFFYEKQVRSPKTFTAQTKLYLFLWVLSIKNKNFQKQDLRWSIKLRRPEISTQLKGGKTTTNANRLSLAIIILAKLKLYCGLVVVRQSTVKECGKFYSSNVPVIVQ